jgi:hypothetical protein
MPATAATAAAVPTVALTTKRFVIRKSLIGTNTVITFVNAKGVDWQGQNKNSIGSQKARITG